ncbi:MAG: excinuclease ABC subunit UvrC [Oleiphilaceae bacterium]|nr:excinuclease ABC subunit UvrC [Oleiphilaceae bacterium]
MAPNKQATTSHTEFDYSARLKQLPRKPGVYRMFNAQGEILYVGKAKNLKNRVTSYFAKQGLSLKTRSLVSKIADIQVTITNSETEALILEQNLIKSLKPPYNILLRDDKSYPYIYLASDKPFPSLSLKRVRSKGKTGRYFGPFPSAASVRESLNLLEKIFKVRQCEESFYRNRSRPCLQYQIKRCKAPCVGLVSQEEYAEDVQHVVMFLQGKNPELIRELMAQMESAAQHLEFEKAAELRDQIDHLRHVQESQAVESGSVDVDVIAMQTGPGVVAFSMLYVRKGRILGHKNYFPKLPLDLAEDELLGAFIEQYYVGQNASRDMPRELVTEQDLQNKELINEALESLQGGRLKFSHRVKSVRAQWLKLAQTNVDSALRTFLTNKENVFHRMDALSSLLGMSEHPKRMECFDISHSHGEKTVGSCVVFNDQGPLKSDYRTYNIEGIEPGDDYAAMRQVLSRRYAKLKDNADKRPDIVFIDGGKGQLNLAIDVLNTLNLGDLNLVGIAKGVTRKPGFETLLVPREDGSLRTIECDADHPGLHLIQQIRDEAHRFAITGHRQRRDKARKQSLLENIEGVGPKRRRELLKYFGSVQNMKTAPAEEIAKVSGISPALAEHIYLVLHGE